jgi:hypothetical protein
MPLGIPEFAPLALAAMEQPGFAIDGQPVRVVASDDLSRTRWLPGEQPFDLELVARDVPPFGARRLTLTPSARVDDLVDDGRRIAADDLAVEAADDGTLCVRFGETRFDGLLAIEDRGDRGDSYDFDPLRDDAEATLQSVSWQRRRHPSGLARLEVRRTFRIPAALDDARERRSGELVRLDVRVEARVAPGVPRVDLSVRIDNGARDHRLRLCFPTGGPVERFQAATTFDVASRSTAPPDDAGWIHRAPHTFAHQGWVSANGLTVVAPGLPEAEVTADGRIAITMLRAVGWLARFDLRSRPIPAGPPLEVPGAQMLGTLCVRMSLLPGCDPAAARAAELGLRGVIGGAAPLLEAGVGLLALDPPSLVLSAVKPPERGDGIVVRVLNPTDSVAAATLRVNLPFKTATAVRLDEETESHRVDLDGSVVRFEVPPHALRSILLT